MVDETAENTEETTESTETAENTEETTENTTETEESAEETEEGTEEIPAEGTEQEATETLEMVTDRTEEDVSNAKEIRRKYQNYLAIQRGATNIDSADAANLTTASKATLERGCLTINTINRVEAKQKELSKRLRGHLYQVETENTTDWAYEGIFTQKEHDRVLKNLDQLRKSFVVKGTTPSTPTYWYQWKNANAVEQILVDIEDNIDSMETLYSQCGTFECGEAV